MGIIWNRINTVILVLVLCALLALIGMVATGVRGGPLDPPAGSPAPTDSVKLPGTPVTGSMTISSSGFYYVTRDLPNVNIIINASNVTLDLGGFTLAKSPPRTGAGIELAPGVKGIVVANGAIVGYERGIRAENSQVRISDVVLRSNGTGAWIGASSVIERCIVLENVDGVFISGGLSAVRDCDVTFNQESGVEVDDQASGVVVERSLIETNNTSLNPAAGGLVFRGSRGTIRDNNFDFNAVADLHFILGQFSTVIDNVFGCPTNVTVGVNNFVPINTSDPHTNRTHFSPCV